MKFFKRALSVFLAVSMCVPSTGMMNMAFATETDTSKASYSVILDESENGSIAFTGIDDKTITASVGETIEVTLNANEGYEVSAFNIADTDSGEAVASKETTDTVFSFTMPDSNLTISANFKEVVETEEVGSEVDKDTTEEVKIPEIAANGTSEYIASQIDDATVEGVEITSRKSSVEEEQEVIVVQERSDENGLAPTFHNILINYNLVNEDTNVNEVKSEDLISSYSQTQQIYALDDNKDCFVSFIDLGKMNNVGESSKVSFSNVNGKSYDDIITYDESAGIAYIPKSLFFNESGEEITLDLQAQVVTKYDMAKTNKSTIKVTIENNNSDVEEVAESQNISVPTFDITTTMPLVTAETAKNLDMSKVNLYINDNAKVAVFDASEYFFDTETGELSISGSPMTIYSIKVVINDDSIADKVVKAVTDEANADVGVHASSVSDIRLTPDVFLEQNYNDLVIDHSVNYDSTTSFKLWENMSEAEKAIVTKYFGYCYFVYSNYEQSEWCYKAITNGGAQLESDYINESGFGYRDDTVLNESAMELYDFLVTLPNSSTKLPLHSIIVSQNVLEGTGAGITAEDLQKDLSDKVTMRVLYKGSEINKNNEKIQYAVFGLSLAYADGTPAAYGVYKIQVNTPTGFVKVSKTSTLPNITDGNDSYTLAGAVYTIFNGNTVVGTLTTDADGNTEALELPVLKPGEKYTIQETKAPLKGYKITKGTLEFTVSQDGTTVVDTTDVPFEDPTEMVLYKYDSIIGREQGDGTLSDAKFEVLYYDGEYSAFSALPNEYERKWTIATKLEYNEEFNGHVGVAKLLPEYIVPESDALYTNAEDKTTRPLGTYVIREKQPSEGYSLNGNMYFLLRNVREYETTNLAEGIIQLVKANYVKEKTYRETGWQNGLHTVTLDTEWIEVKEDTYRGGFHFDKWDWNDESPYPQGNADDMSARYEVTNMSDHDVAINPDKYVSLNMANVTETKTIDGITYYVFSPNVEMFTFVTNKGGIYESTNDLLPYGTYKITEITPPDHYQLEGILTTTFSIREDGVIVTADPIQNKIQRGGIHLIKYDAEDMTSTDQGDGDLEGTYTITNKSKHYVWIKQDPTITMLKNYTEDSPKILGGDTWYKFEPDAAMFSFTTTNIGEDVAAYVSATDLLPYGSYHIEETATTDSYLITTIRRGNYTADFSITEQGQVYDFGKTMINPVKRGGFVMSKNDADRKDDIESSKTPQGDATFEGAVYEVINLSKEYAWIPDDGTITILTDNVLDSQEIDGKNWYKFAPDSEMFTFETNAEGRYSSSLDLLPYGTFAITEVSASEGYRVSTDRDLEGSNGVLTQIIKIREEEEVIDLTIDQEDKTKTFYEEVIRGGVTMSKNDADVYSQYSTTAQGDATFEKAIYDIYNISDSYVWVDSNNDNVLSDDEYYEPIDTSDIDLENTAQITYADVEGFTPCYTLITDKAGLASTERDSLPYGKYLIVERTPSEGYLNSIVRDGIVAHTATVREEGVLVDLRYDDEDLLDTFYEPIIRGGFDFNKNDEETGVNVPLGSANLQATYTVTNKSLSYVWIKAEDGITLSENYIYYDEATGYYCYPKNAEMFSFETDAHTGHFESSNILLPYGTYTIKEVVPPTGYLLLSDRNPSMSTTFSVREEQVMVDQTQEIFNYVMRGDVFFTKKDAETGMKIPYIPFLITSLDQDGEAIESHLVYTDKNGDFYTATDYVYHTYKTNIGDTAVEDMDKLIELVLTSDEETIKDFLSESNRYTKDDIKAFMNELNGMCTGTWFGVDTTASDDLRLSNTGALPFGTYRLDELPCEANDGKLLVHDQFIISNEASRTNATINPLGWQYGPFAGNVNFGSIYNWEKPVAPALFTEALVEDTESHYSSTRDDMVIVDTVAYEGLIRNQDYTMVATVVDAETGEVLHDMTGDISTTSKNFHTVDTDGYVKMYIDVDTTGYEGRTIVVYETLYDEDGNIFVDHSDPTDENQQIHFPSVSTGAIVEETNEQVSLAKKDVTIIDTVSYDNLEVGRAYKVKSYLVNVADGKVAVDDYGNEIECETPFKPTVKSGTFEVKFTFDAATLEGQKYVVYEEIYKNGVLVSAHTDIDDEKQSIWFPGTVTKALDTMTNTQMSFAEGETTIIDNVAYNNVKPSLTYTINGELVDKETGDILATAETSIVPTSEAGNIDVEFTLDVTGMAGETLVAYQTISYNGIIVGEHIDIDDVKETIYLPKITTNAFDKENNTKMSKADSDVVIIDTVEYENIVVGSDYTIAGYLVDVETGMPVLDANGEMIMAATSFTAETANGSADVEFVFDGTLLAGTTVVAFETLTVETENDSPIIAAHEDINDENQTIYLPSIATKASDDFNKQQISKAGKSTILDVITYTNLIVGEEYEVSGQLVNKANNEIVSTATTKFTAKSTNGTVDVKFTADTTDLAGATLVALQDITYKGFSIATADDLEDLDETIYIPKITTEALDAENGTHVSNADSSVTIIDTVTYENLIPGKEYTVFGTVVDKETGEPLQSHIIDREAYIEYGDGIIETWTCEQCGTEFSTKAEVMTHFDSSEGCSTYALEMEREILNSYEEISHYGDIVGKTTFTPETANGTVKITFNFDGTELEGKTVVLFEELFMANSDESVFTEKYTCQGCNKVFGSKAEVLSHFGESDGCTTYTLTFETDMISIAEHKDLNDAKQTIHLPKLTKTEIEKLNAIGFALNSGLLTTAQAETESLAVIPGGNHYIQASETSSVIDTVTYENLIPGLSYTIVGTLVDKTTGSATEETASVTFTPTEAYNDVELTFMFDSTKYAGRTLVATEKAFINETDEVASYDDLNDLDKTIYVVDLSTSIADEGTQINVATKGKTTIIDTVSFAGLEHGEEYILNGVLIDPETGEEYQADVSIKDNTADETGDGEIVNKDEVNTEVDTTVDITEPTTDEVKDKDTTLLDVINDTIKEIFTPTTSSTTTFTPSTSKGTIDVIFTIDTVDMQGKTLIAFEELLVAENPDYVIADHKDLDDENQQIHIADLVADDIVDVLTEMRLTAYDKEAKIKVTASYSNIVAGTTYSLVSSLVDANTGDVVGEAITNTITPDETSGSVEVEFVVDTTTLAGTTLVAEHELICNDKVIALQKSTADSDLTVKVAKLTTSAICEATTSQTTPAKDEVTVIDTVKYENLIPGVEYTLKGQIIDPNTTTEMDENIVTTTFTPELASGSTEVKFTVDTSTLSGKSLVVLETLSYKDIVVAVHKDTTDVEQTVYVPSIKGNIVDKDTNTKVVSNSTEATVIDTITCTNLTVGTEYVIVADLMASKAGKSISTVEYTFEADKAEQVIDLEFAINASDLAGDTLIASETLSSKDVELVKDITVTDAHKVFVGEIDTVALDKLTNKQVAAYSDKDVVIDTITYSNLVAGLEYTVDGGLVNTATGDVIAKASKTFTPDETSGSVQLEFIVDSTKYVGQTYVATETLSLGKVEVAAHEDLTDRAQSIHVATIKTDATVNGKKEAEVSKTTVIIDTISYSNLVPGVEYDITGTLMDKETGKALSSGGKVITSTVSFIPTKAADKVEVEFKFDSSAIANRTVVIFEDLTVDGVKVATHSDLSDKAQSIKFTGKTIIVKPSTSTNKPSINTSTSNKPSISTSTSNNSNKVNGDTVQTGDNYMMIIVLMGLSVLTAGVGFLFLKKKKK